MPHTTDRSKFDLELDVAYYDRLRQWVADAPRPQLPDVEYLIGLYGINAVSEAFANHTYDSESLTWVKN